MGIPDRLRAGDTWAWTESSSDYPASDGWALTYSLVPVAGGAGKITITAVAAGADHSISVPAATTASYAAGNYAVLARVGRAGEVRTIDVAVQSITVSPDLSALATFDSRSTAAKALDKVNAWLSGDKSLEVAGYTVADRQIQHYSLTDLLKLRDALRAEVSSEIAAARLSAGLPDQRNLYIRFGVR